jgi:hypothetical protein
MTASGRQRATAVLTMALRAALYKPILSIFGRSVLQRIRQSLYGARLSKNVISRTNREADRLLIARVWHGNDAGQRGV